MEPVSVQVITYAPTVFRHCQHCEVAIAGIGLGERIHRAEAQNALPDDLLQDFQQVSDFVHSLLERHGPRVRVSVIDAASIEGVWKSLRHGVRRYPAVVVDGRDRLSGTAFEQIDRVIEARLREHARAAEKIERRSGV
jgi:glutaredoxin